MLESYGTALNVALVGASGGIGRGMLELLLADPNIATVHSFCRQPLPAAERHIPRGIDITDEQSVSAAAAKIEPQSLQLVLVTTGMLHGENVQPEKTVRQLSADSFQQLMTVNTLGPMLVAQHFLPLLSRKQRAAFAALSARVGSISDNRLGGWYSYRASKAALNMMLRCLSIGCRVRYPQLVVAGLHPGTVETSLSAPFRGGVPADKLFAPDFSANQLLQVLDQLTPEMSGGVFDWQGKPIPA